jgi:pimeloyl-ACP methyl ester carboxylesterase
MTLFVLLAVALVALSLVRLDVPVARLLPKYATGASRFAVLDGVNVHYRDEGSGPPLVLLHGTSSTLYTWDGWVSQLASKRRLIRLDLPGGGLTGPAPDHDYGDPRFVRIVVALMDRLGIDRADVAGNSRGGRIAIDLALEHPDRVRSLILIDSRGLPGAEPTALDAIVCSPIGRALRWITPRAFIRRSIAGVYGDPARLREDAIDRYYDLFRREGNRAALREMLCAREPSVEGRLLELRLPVLLQWGERDRRVPVAFGRRFAEGIPGARLVVYGSAGHLPMEELPEETARDAEAFLASLGAVS